MAAGSLVPVVLSQEKRQAFAHCQVSCGIFGDENRFKGLSYDVTAAWGPPRRHRHESAGCRSWFTADFCRHTAKSVRVVIDRPLLILSNTHDKTIYRFTTTTS